MYKIVNISKENLIELNKTIFYPGGGGQPCDTGIIKNNNFKGEVIEVYKEGNKIIHKVKAKCNLKVGDNVELILNKERRDNLVRMHTGEHILFKSLETVLKDVTLNKINLDEQESSLFINTKKLYWQLLFKAEAMANKIIAENRPIIDKEYTKKEAIKLGKLRIKPERIKSDTVRVIEIKDFDWSACAGIHADSTGFVVNILITKFNFVKDSYEIRFKTNVNIYDYTKTSRQASSLLESNDVLNSIKKLQEDLQEYKEKFRQLSYKLLDNYQQEKINDITLIHNITENIEKKQLVDKAVALSKKNTVVCFINLNDNAVILLNTSLDLKINTPKLLNKVISKYEGKGGGRDNFAMGSFNKKYLNKLIPELKSQLT